MTRPRLTSAQKANLARIRKKYISPNAPRARPPSLISEPLGGPNAERLDTWIEQYLQINTVQSRRGHLLYARVCVPVRLLLEMAREFGRGSYVILLGKDTTPGRFIRGSNQGLKVANAPDIFYAEPDGTHVHAYWLDSPHELHHFEILLRDGPRNGLPSGLPSTDTFLYVGVKREDNPFSRDPINLSALDVKRETPFPAVWTFTYRADYQAGCSVRVDLVLEEGPDPALA